MGPSCCIGGPPPTRQCINFEGAFATGVDSVSWMGNNCAKLLSSQSDAPHCWTSSTLQLYGKRNKSSTAEKVKMGMLKGVEAVLGLPKSSLQKPVYTRVQLCSSN